MSESQFWYVIFLIFVFFVILEIVFGVCWCNPPYSRRIGDWVKKAYESDATVVMLLPARTDTKWFHDYVLPFAEIRFIKGRLYFGGSSNPAPFLSMVVIFRKLLPEC